MREKKNWTHFYRCEGQCILLLGLPVFLTEHTESAGKVKKKKE